MSTYRIVEQLKRAWQICRRCSHTQSLGIDDDSRRKVRPLAH